MVNLERNFEGAATPSTASRSPSPRKTGEEKLPRAALRQNPLQGAAVHVEAAGGL
jgi:hypothetical protein